MIRPEDIRPSTPPTLRPGTVLRAFTLMRPPAPLAPTLPHPARSGTGGVLLPRPADATCDGGEPEVRR